MLIWKILLWATGGNQVLAGWLAAFIAGGIIMGVVNGFFRARKIQPKGFKWKTLRNEALFGTINVLVSGTMIALSTKWLTDHGVIVHNQETPAYWVMALEYAAYFFLFDTWFYWLHRWMHKEPVYSWVHKLHHRSTAPNVLTTISVNPLESFINGGFVPIFLSLYSVHEATLPLITGTNIIMGLYVHSGYELLPRWWNKSWATKWFISATFHDQHHKYFTVNFGGYTTIWDRICGTMRPKFEADFDSIKARATAPKPVAEAAALGQ